MRTIDGAGRTQPLCLGIAADARCADRTVQHCFERLFERHGLPGAIRSDNGSPFAHVDGLLGLSRLSAWWVALGIDLERGRPGHPQDNGGHERLHRDIGMELEPGTAQRDAWICGARSLTTRPHEALGMKCPGQFIATPSGLTKAAPKIWNIRPWHAAKWDNKEPSYGRGMRLFVTTSLAGWSVGLKAAGQWTTGSLVWPSAAGMD